MTEVREHELLYKIYSLLLRAHEESDVFERIAELLCKNLQFYCCSIWLAKPNDRVGQQRLAFFAMDSDLLPELSNLDFRAALQAMKSESPFEWHGSEEFLKDHKLRSQTKPLLSQGNVVGAISLWIVDGRVSENAILFIDSISADFTQGLLNYRNFFTPNQKRLNKELEIARRIQTSFLPRKGIEHSSHSLAFRSMMAHEVGGDYLDLFQTHNKLLGIAIGDVMGKGIPAALWMAMTRVALHTVAKSGAQPHIVLEGINRALYGDLIEQGTIITLAYAIYEPAQKVLLLSNAGHPPPIVYHSTTGQYELLKVKGSFIGSIKNRKYQLTGVQLKAGDIVLFYSDGLTEATNSQGEQFGIQNVVDVISKNAFFDAQQIVDSLTLHISQFIDNCQQADDITFACLRVR